MLVEDDKTNFELIQFLFLIYVLKQLFFTKAKNPQKMGMLITQQIIDRVPNWASAGWQVGDTVNFGNWNDAADAIANRILTNDAFAAFMNEHPPHRPS